MKFRKKIKKFIKKLKKKLPKKAFTLVELIVVITILAILGTIAFLSFQGYSVSARNSTRVADLGTINSALSLNKLRSGKFLPPSLGVEITYSGSEVWTQGSFGNETRQKLGDRGELTKVPVDPLTQNEYTYSVLNTKREISLAAVMEGEYGYNNNLLLDKTYAAGREGRVYIKGSYNGKVAKVSSGTTTYVLAVPTIISGDIALTDIIALLNSRKLSFNNSQVLPSTYTEGVFNNNLPTENIVNTDSIVVFSGAIEDLKIEAFQNNLIDNLQNAYSGTIVTNLSPVAEIISSNDDNKTLLAQTIIKEGIIPSLEITAKIINTAFVSTWDTSKTTLRSTNEFTIQLPLESNGTYDFTVDWGDGSTDHITNYMAIHNYTNTGVYDITIRGQLEGFAFKGQRDRGKILDVKNWGPNFRFGNTGGYFRGCSNLTGFSATDTPNLEGTTNMSRMFLDATSFNQSLNNWDVSKVTNMENMFWRATSFNQPLNNWDVSEVTNMSGMFFFTDSFNGNISNWNVSKVTNMHMMLYGAISFNQPLNNWDVSKVTDMGAMFYRAKAFNQPLNNWDVSKVTNMISIFLGTKAFNQPLNNWDVSKVTDMLNVFNGATLFNQPLNNWDVSKVTNMRYMFNQAANFDQDISGWNVDEVTSFRGFSLSTSPSWTASEKPSF